MIKTAWKWVAGVALTGLMGASLVYYNFIDKPNEAKLPVGTVCPDFTANTFQASEEGFYYSEETFTLSQNRDKVCVVNFWETWCTACIAELPDFNQIQEDYEGKVEVVAVAGVTTPPTGTKGEDIDEWLNKNKPEWKDFSLTFAYMSEEQFYTYGYAETLPRTVIVNKDGIVVYEANASMHYEDLQALIEPLL